MTVSLTCYLDAFSGISGDMTVGALAGAGADRAAIVEAIASLEIGAAVSFEDVRRAGIGAVKYHVMVEPQHAHRHLSHIVRLIERGHLSDRARQDAIAVFQRLGEAEADVHRVPIEKVHFHEVGAADSIADIVGACVALDSLNVDELGLFAVECRQRHGKTEHGLLPVPAPATAQLLAGVPVFSHGPAMELTTPTGAALAVTLAASFGALPPMTIRGSGYGAGGHDFRNRPTFCGDAGRSDVCRPKP